MSLPVDWRDALADLLLAGVCPSVLDAMTVDDLLFWHGRLAVGLQRAHGRSVSD